MFWIHFLCGRINRYTSWVDSLKRVFLIPFPFMSNFVIYCVIGPGATEKTADPNVTEAINLVKTHF